MAGCASWLPQLGGERAKGRGVTVFAWLTKTQWFYPVTLVNLDRIGYRELALTSQKTPTNPSRVFFCDTILLRKVQLASPTPPPQFISLSLMLSSLLARSADRKEFPLQAVLLPCQPNAQRAFPLLLCLVRPLSSPANTGGGSSN